MTATGIGGYAFDPELALALSDVPVVDLRDIPAARRARSARTAAVPPPELGGLEVEDLTVGGTEGPVVRVRVYRPTRLRGSGAILHVHGGGFVLGDVEMDHPHCVWLSRELGVVVVSVDYALAPEHPFPRPVEDVWQAWLWLVRAAPGLGADPDHLVLHGISAGGALATAVALRAECTARRPAFLHLVSPVLDDRLDTLSMTAFTDTPIWDHASARRSWAAYLGAEVAGGSTVVAEAAPARAPSLAGLPPTYLAITQFDPLRDEALAFARALVRDGVRTEAHLFPGTFHTSAGVVPAAGVSRRQHAEELRVLGEQVGT